MGGRGGRGSLPSDLGQDLHLLFLSIFLLLLPPPSLLEKVRYCPGFPRPPKYSCHLIPGLTCLLMGLLNAFWSLALSFSAFRDTGTPAFICEANRFPCPAILAPNLVSAALNKHPLIPVPPKSAWPREAVLLTYTPSASHLPQAPLQVHRPRRPALTVRTRASVPRARSRLKQGKNRVPRLSLSQPLVAAAEDERGLDL